MKENDMNYNELEQTLRRRIRTRRIVEAVLTAVFLAVAILFAVLYEQSRVVDEIAIGPIKYQNVSYNRDLAWGILAGVLPGIPAGIILIADFVFSRFVTVSVGGDYVTLYRGLLHTNLYVNGEKRESIVYGYYLEATLSDQTTMTVSLGKWSAHATFSGHYPPIDL